jgi:hypothetical protein
VNSQPLERCTCPLEEDKFWLVIQQSQTHVSGKTPIIGSKSEEAPGSKMEASRMRAPMITSRAGVVSLNKERALSPLVAAVAAVLSRRRGKHFLQMLQFFTVPDSPEHRSDIRLSHTESTGAFRILALRGYGRVHDKNLAAATSIRTNPVLAFTHTSHGYSILPASGASVPREGCRILWPHR